MRVTISMLLALLLFGSAPLFGSSEGVRESMDLFNTGNVSDDLKKDIPSTDNATNKHIINNIYRNQGPGENIEISDAIIQNPESNKYTNSNSPFVISFLKTDVKCFGDNTGTIDITVTGTTGTETYLWNDGATTADRTGLVAGNYSVTVTDGTDINVQGITISQPNLLSISNISSNSPICQGSNLNLSVTAAGGTPPYLYSWNGPNSFTSTLQNPNIPHVLPLASGTYSVIITDAKGCTTLSNNSVIVNHTPSLIDPADQIICSGAPSTPITFTGTASSYSWTNSNPSLGLPNSGTGDITSFTAFNSGISPVFATIVVTPIYSNAGLDCPGSTQTFSITVPPSAPSSPGIISGATSLCPNISGQIYSISAVTKATNYSWTVPSGWSITNGQGTTSITVTAGSDGQNGNISVTAENSCGTSPVQTLPVSVISVPSPSISAEYCTIPGKIILTAHPDGLNYVWSNGATTQSITIDEAAVYSVTVLCGATAYFTVGTELVTDGSFTGFNAASPTFFTEYIQNQGFIDGVNTGLGPEGRYAVNTSAWSNYPGTPNGYHKNFHGRDHTNNTVGPRNFMMVNGSDVMINTPAPSHYRIIWQQIITISPNTNYYFSAWGMNLNPVSPARLQFQIVTAQRGTEQVGTIADLDVAPKPGTEAAVAPSNWVRFYSTPFWKSPAGATIATIRISNLNTEPNGNDFGLDDISFGTLAPFPSTIAPSSNASTLCIGQTLNLYANLTGGKAPYTFAWTGPAGFTSNIANPSIPNAAVANSGIYTLTITDGFGCGPVTASVSPVTINPLPTLTSPLLNNGCSNQQFSYTPLLSIPGTTYTWSRAAVPGINNLPATGTGPINEVLVNSTNAPINVVYKFDLTSPIPQSCTNTQNVVVSVNPEPVFAITADKVRACVGEPITILANPGTMPGYTYSLTYIPDASGIYPVIPTFNDNSTGVFVVYPIAGIHTFRLTANSVSGCTYSQDILIKVYDIPLMTISASCANATLTLSGTINNSNFTNSGDIGVVEYSYDNRNTWTTSTVKGPLPLGIYTVYGRNSINTSCYTSITASILSKSVLSSNVRFCQNMPSQTLTAFSLCVTWEGATGFPHLMPISTNTYRVAQNQNPPYVQGAIVSYAAASIFTTNSDGVISFKDCPAIPEFSYSIYEFPFNPQKPDKGFIGMFNSICTGQSITLDPSKYYQFVVNDHSLTSSKESKIQFVGNHKAQVIKAVESQVSWYRNLTDAVPISTSATLDPVAQGIIPNTPGKWTFYASCGSSSSCREPIDYIIDPIPTASALGTNVTCSNQESNIQLSSVDMQGNPVPAGSVTYTWNTSIRAANLAKVSISHTSCTSGCGDAIKETVINNGTTTAYVDFTITAQAGDCMGNTFLYTLVVEPMPDFSITNTNSTICPSANPVMSPIQITSINSNLINGLQYVWSRSNTTNLSATPAGVAVPASGTGSPNGFAISGTLPGLIPNSLQTTLFTINAQVNSHTCVSKTTQVTVGDNIAPLISCPGNKTIICAADIPAAANNYASFVALGGTASDNCTSPPVLQYITPDQLSGTPCNKVIRRTYRAIDYAGNYSECYQDITITDNTRPSFVTLPAASMDRCVYRIFDAIFYPPTIDITPSRPDYYDLIPNEKAALDNITFSDNCGATLYWKLVDSSGNPILDQNADLLINKTDKIAFHPIRLMGAEKTNVVYRLIYWLVDDCGNKSDDFTVTITIYPRPDIIKTTI